MRKTSLTSKKIALSVAQIADEKKAEDIVVLKMTSVANFCDYFVICSGTSDRHVKAIANGVEEWLLETGLGYHKQGEHNADWVVFDTGDVMTHIFHKPVREFYQLEHLWQEAKKVEWDK